jgi:hypothetical protein
MVLTVSTASKEPAAAMPVALPIRRVSCRAAGLSKSLQRRMVLPSSSH